MKDEDLIYLFTGTSEIFIKNRMNRIIQSFNKYEYTIIKYDMETTSKIDENLSVWGVWIY